ncbi:MAG: 50S ribosomal protein L21 [Rhodobiaceae bacterium]|nr:50S ribosomal protein L21 [Rhodobiaceae bacterium]
MYAVIKTGGKQYKVAPNDLLRVEKLDAESGAAVVFDEVLVVGDGETVSLGTPVVEGASVAAEVVEQTRDRKIIVFKKKRRQGYRRTKGHRQHVTVVKITDILTGGAKPKAAKKAEKPKVDDAPKAEAAAEAVAPLFEAPAGAPDDLKKISGVGPVLEKKLHALGITKYAQVAAFTAEDIQRVDDALSFKGRIEREDWVSQAAALAAEAGE